MYYVDGENVCCGKYTPNVFYIWGIICLVLLLLRVAQLKSPQCRKRYSNLEQLSVPTFALKSELSLQYDRNEVICLIDPLEIGDIYLLYHILLYCAKKGHTGKYSFLHVKRMWSPGEMNFFPDRAVASTGKVRSWNTKQNNYK